ncbi:hypothetical protein IC582_014018 [Cucumis melo]
MSREHAMRFPFVGSAMLLCNGWENGRDDFYVEDQETHSTMLDKLLAWEKKLYDEVKFTCFRSRNHMRQSLSARL